jgi:hypothetical protein
MVLFFKRKPGGFSYTQLTTTAMATTATALHPPVGRDNKRTHNTPATQQRRLCFVLLVLILPIG